MNTRESKMLESISEELGVPNLLEVISSAPMHRLVPILVHAFKKKVAAKSPHVLLREYEDKQGFYGTSTLSQPQLYAFAGACHEAIATAFGAVQTAPIAPLGLNSVLSKVSQNNTLSTIRGSEVVSDLTSQLALECALRRKQGANVVHLCTYGRVLRLQPFDKERGYMQHFNMFALCSGGRNSSTGGDFAVPTLRSHISSLLDIIDALRKLGYDCDDITVNMSDMRFLDQLITAQGLPREEVLRNSLNDEFDLLGQYQIDFPREVASGIELTPAAFARLGLEDRSGYFSVVEDKIISPLRIKYPNVRFCFDFTRKAGLGYYPHLCFHIFARSRTRTRIQVCDGGAVDWLTKLLGSPREAMVISGIGAELMQKLFG